MIFYNGFNLMCDILSATAAGLFFYRVGFREGINHERELNELMADYYLDQARESE
jgi:hypothetical protein